MYLAVIPARGGSKRIPRKNIRPFASKPMLGYAIAAARQTGLFSHVVVSTDDDEIAAVARSEGAETPFQRPLELADDHAPTVPVIAHAITECARLGWEAAKVCCIYPSVPLLQASDILSALDALERSQAAYSFPVIRFSSPVQRALKRDTLGIVAPLYPEYASTRTQDLEPAYHDAGQFYWGRTDAWLNGLNIHRNATTIVLPEWRAIDIDTEDDWIRAEALFRAVRQLEAP